MKLSEAIQLAKSADAAWQSHLERCGFKSRWDEGTQGKPGTLLRNSYEMKVLADRIMHTAFEESRAPVSSDHELRVTQAKYSNPSSRY